MKGIIVDTLLQAGLSNAFLASLLALAAAVVSRAWRRPAVAHGLWLLVLLKLVTPPLLAFPLPLPAWSQPRPALREFHGVSTEPATLQSPDTFDTRLAGSRSEGGNAEERLAVIPEPAAVEAALATSEDGPGLESAIPRSFSWQGIAVAIWLTGSVVWWAVAMRRLYRFQQLLRHAEPARGRPGAASTGREASSGG